MAKANEVRVDDIVKMANDRFASYGYPKGTLVKVTYKSGTTINVGSQEGGSPISVTVGDVERAAKTKEEIQREIKNLKELLKVREERLKWMEDTKSELYDEDEFKVWQILSTMDSKSSKIDKARAIAAIVKK